MIGSTRIEGGLQPSELVAIERDDVSHVPLHQQPITWAARKGVSLAQAPDNQLRLWLVRAPAK